MSAVRSAPHLDGLGDVTERCSSCGLNLNRHGWAAALCINTWWTILLVMGWVVAGFVVTDGDGGWWVSAGAVATAVVVPGVSYRFAKALMLRLLLRFDPPDDGGSLDE